MKFTIGKNEINSLKKGVEGQGNLEFKTSDTPDDRLNFTITSEDLTSFKDMDDGEDKDLTSAMSMAFALGLSDTVRGVQQLSGRETNYITGRNMKEEQNELKDLKLDWCQTTQEEKLILIWDLYWRKTMGNNWEKTTY